MPLYNKQTGSNKRVRITSSRFDDEEESIAVRKTDADSEEEEDDYDDENDDDSGELVSDQDVSDDEQEDSDHDEDEDEVLQRLEKITLKISENNNDPQAASTVNNLSNRGEKYYEKLIEQASKEPEYALDYDYQEADEDEYLEKAHKSKDNVAVYNPNLYQLAEDEELEFSNSAYTLFHRMDVEWPCLSLGLIDDELGQQRVKFPMTQYLVGGSQADQRNKNRLYVLKMSNLRSTQYDSDEDADSSDDENEDENKNSNNNLVIPTKDPILEHLYVPLDAEVNRVRLMPQNNKMVALMCADSTVRIFNIESQFDLLSRDVKRAANKKPVVGVQRAVQILKSHKNEGFALDWSPVQQGRLGSGDFDATICVHDVQPDGKWKLLNSYKRHQKSVEDIQWSPNEANVFASCGCDGKVLIWDTRQSKREGLSFDVSSTDVNCVAWNKLKQHHIATGDDNGIITVWDMKTIATNGGKPEAIARFNYLEGEHVTSMEWHPYDESVLAVSTDNRITLWDLGVEKDEEEQMQDEQGVEIPEQLLFEHYGKSVKDVHWSQNLKDVLVCTGEMGIELWRPAHVFDAKDEEKQEQQNAQ